MKKILLATLLTFTSGILMAKPYPQHDVKKEVLSQKSINLGAADQIMQDLLEQAGSYPTRFDNEADKKRASTDVIDLLYFYIAALETEVIKPKDKEYPSFLWHVARLGWVAHNMDVNVPKTAQIADKYYSLLLDSLPAKSKEKWQTQIEYGTFLVSIDKIDVAERVLKQSINEGNAMAGKSLAIALIGQGKKEEAISALRTYVKKFPQDTQAKDLLDAIESGRFKVQTAQ